MVKFKALNSNAQNKLKIQITNFKSDVLISEFVASFML